MAAPLPKVPIPPRGVDFRGKVVLAPMVRSGELPLRLVALHYGADLVWGPEIVDHALVGATRRVDEATGTVEWTCLRAATGPPSIVFRARPQEEGSRLIFQIGTSDPARAVQAARLVAGDVAGIDVNAGCPKPFSTRGGMGAALLRTPDRLCAILEALVAVITPEFGIGISVKIRLLPDPVDTEALVRRLCATGITALTVHCRFPATRPQQPAVREQIPAVVAVCRDSGVACLLNGDIADRDHARDLMAALDVDGAMIASAAERNPSCFRARADGGLASWDEVATRFLRTAVDVGHPVGKAKILLASMAAGKIGDSLSRIKTYVGLCDALDVTDILDKARLLEEAVAARLADKAEVVARLKAERLAEKANATALARSDHATDQPKPGQNDGLDWTGATLKRKRASSLSIPSKLSIGYTVSAETRP